MWKQIPFIILKHRLVILKYEYIICYFIRTLPTILKIQSKTIKLPMKKSLSHLFFLLLLTSNLLAQEFVAFEKPIESTIIGNRSFTNEKGEECTLASNSIVEILGRGYGEFKGKYYFKNNECSGFISSVWFTGGDGFKDQDMKVNPKIYEINNAQAYPSEQLH
tara:strand:- start:20 stop:508 length:489 start_codon:yes stop_codon:yes gene_type:complete